MRIHGSLRTKLREFIFFAVIGVMNTAVDFLVLNLLILLTHHDQGWWLLPFDGIALMAGLINSYILNGRFTFRNSGPGNSWRFIRFVAVNVVGLVINTLVVWGLSPVLSGIVYPVVALNMSKVLATLFTLCWNYFALKRWIFRPETTVETAPYVLSDGDENVMVPVGSGLRMESEMEGII